MNSKTQKGLYSPIEEKANFWTHLLGVLGGLMGVIILLLNPNEYPQLWSTMIFFGSCILLYASSSLYHWAEHEDRKRLFKKLDHISIYILIAGTFTPFCFGLLASEPIGRQLGIAIWVIAFLGTIFKLFFTGKYEVISLLSYLGMGWMGYLMFDRLGALAGPEVVDLMLYGGISYTLGVMFYVWRSLKFHHAIWHLFVVGGTLFHSLAILKL